MNKLRRMVPVLAAAALLAVVLGGGLEARTQEAAKAPADRAAVTPLPEEPGVPPRPPGERMEVAVLLAWIWLSIAVLFWLLRLRVREADRVFRMGLRRQAEKAPKKQGP